MFKTYLYNQIEHNTSALLLQNRIRSNTSLIFKYLISFIPLLRYNFYKNKRFRQPFKNDHRNREKVNYLGIVLYTKANNDHRNTNIIVKRQTNTINMNEIKRKQK